jgi:hypothetical protein
MDEAAGADHQHAFRAQAASACPSAKCGGGIGERIHRQRHDRNIRLRIHAPQRHPDAVIQAVAGTHLGRQAGARQSPAMSSASSGEPGAGYWSWYSGSENRRSHGR